MARKGYYLKATGRGTTPGLIVSVVVSERATRGEECDPRCRERVFHSVSVAWSYHSKSGWTHPRTSRFGSADEFWRWLDGKGKTGRRCYVFPPIASDALTLLCFWPRVVPPDGGRDADPRHPPAHGTAPAVGRGVRLRRLVLNGRPDVVTYDIGGCSFVWLSGRQFFDNDADGLASALSGSGDDPAEHRGGGAATYRGPSERATVWLRAMTTFADWWQSLGAGPFPRTVPGAAMQFLRSRLPKQSIVVHRDEETYLLERAACHGGRASCWYYGTVVARRIKDRVLGIRPDKASDDEMVGPVYRVDVRSMYPALLRDREYPVSVVKYSERWDGDDVQSLARRYGVIADVDVATGEGEYPHRSGERVVYPVGSFRSVLCGVELARAMSEGIVKRVWRAAAYEMGRPYASAAAELCRLRDEYRRQGRTAWELLVKILSNSLAGKLAQRPRGWQELPGERHHPEWDVWISHNADTGTSRRWRCTAGRVFEYKDTGVGQGTLTAGFAFLTSYGRSVMRSYREACPPRSVLSQDTDGLWVTAAGLAALRSCGALRANPGPGELREVEQISEGYWLDPRHYCTSHGWVLAGYHRPTVSTSRLVRDTYDVNPVRTGCTEPPDSIQTFTRYAKLPAPPPAHLIDSDGWAIPPTLPDPVRPPAHFPPPDDPEPEPPPGGLGG